MFISRLFMVVSVLGRSFTSLASVFNIVHTFVCGDDAWAFDNKRE